MYKKLNEKDIKEIILQYENKKSCKEIANLIGCSKSNIFNIIKNISRKRKIYNLDENYFNKIDTEEKAYWLGFIYADGCIVKNSLIIALANQDLNHIEKIKNALKSNAQLKFRKSNNSWAIWFNSKIMVNDLKKHGITPAKSLTIICPKINKKLLRHFYRGYFDGDGWISIRSNRKRKNKNCISVGMVSGSKIFLDQFNQWIKNHIEHKCNVIKRKTSNAFQITFEGVNLVNNILNILYKNAIIFLDRKHEIIMRSLK